MGRLPQLHTRCERLTNHYTRLDFHSLEESWLRVLAKTAVCLQAQRGDRGSRRLNWTVTFSVRRRGAHVLEGARWQAEILGSF